MRRAGPGRPSTTMQSSPEPVPRSARSRPPTRFRRRRGVARARPTRRRGDGRRRWRGAVARRRLAGGLRRCRATSRHDRGRSPRPGRDAQPHRAGRSPPTASPRPTPSGRCSVATRASTSRASLVLPTPAAPVSTTQLHARQRGGRQLQLVVSSDERPAIQVDACCTVRFGHVRDPPCVHRALLRRAQRKSRGSGLQPGAFSDFSRPAGAVFGVSSPPTHDAGSGVRHRGRCGP